MKDEHIIQILDNTGFGDLSENEMAIIQTHTTQCENCSQRFEAAKISSILLKTHAAQTFEPSPFFQTKVLAALREQQTKSVAAFWRWWQASSAMVSGMLLAVGLLIVLTLFAPNSADTQDQVSALADSTETIIFNEKDLSGELTNGQALQIIYEQQNSH